MDFFFHYTNPNFHSSSSSSSLVITPNNKTMINNSFHGKDQVDKKKNNKRTNNNNNNNKITTKAVKLSTDPQSVAARERRHRISDKFKILRSMIPGGDTRNMDTVSMLEEAIQYVKYLKSQIWLHQTMISFENFDDHNYNLDQYYPHQHHFQTTFDHLNDEMLLPHDQLGFAEGSSSSLKVEGEYDNMVYHAIYP